MTDCDALRRLISPYLDGELVGEDRTAFETHLARCPSCRKSLEEEARIVAALQAAPPRYEVPTALRERVDRLFDDAERARPETGRLRPWRLGLAAALRRDFARHRAWMMRGYAIGLGAGTQVWTLVPWLLAFGVPGEFTRAMLMAAGWVINLVVAEWVIRSRPLRQTPSRRVAHRGDASDARVLSGA